MKILHTLQFIPLLLCLVSGAALADDPAGKVVSLKGDAWVQDGAVKKQLDEGSFVFAGDQIETGKKTSLDLRFVDDTYFSLGSRAKLNVDSFSREGEADAGFAASILKGAFRFVSGLLGKKSPDKFKVDVTVATIGIRGTHVAGEVFERQEGDGGIVEASARIMLLEDEENDSSAIEVSNQYGSVVIDEPGYGTEIPDEHSPPGPVQRMKIRTVNNLLRSIRNTSRRKLP